MEGQLILVLLVTVPVILFPAVFVWYLNIGALLKLTSGKMAEKAVKKVT